MKGTMVISLDFELMWGVLDKMTIQEYGSNILQGRVAIDKILKSFQKYRIHATWAVVGLIFLDDFKNMESLIPDEKPNYTNKKLSSYNYIPAIKESDRQYFFARDLIQRISNESGQEIASHTFSHYYCKEEGQDIKDFETDIKKAVQISKENGFDVKSIVFPRNQSNKSYRGILLNNQIKNYRGNEKGICYEPCSDDNDKWWKRGLRLADSYLNLLGYQCYDYIEILENGLNNIRGSRFLRPYSRKLHFLENLRIRRIKKQMRYAAKKGKVFHLWWHPHNFGKNTEKNIAILEILLDYFEKLHCCYGFQSKNMQELGDYVNESFNVGW